MIKYFIYSVFLFLCGISIISCKFEETVADYENIHDVKSENYTPPGPDHLWVARTSDTFIEIRWYDNSLGEKGFIVEKSESTADKFTAIDTVIANTKAYIDSFDVKLGVNYYYRVKAFGPKNTSAYSNSVSTMAVLNAPTKLEFSFIYNKPILSGPVLSWLSDCSFVKNYIIESRIVGESQNFTKIAETGPTQNYYETNALDSSKVYEFRVTAVTAKHTSAASDIAVAFYGFLSDGVQFYNSSSGESNVDFCPVRNDFVAASSDYRPDYYYSSFFAVYNADQQRVNFRLASPYSGPVKYSPSGNIIVLGNPDYIDRYAQNYTTFIDAFNGNVLGTIPLVTRSLDFSADGTLLAVGSNQSEYGHPKFIGLVDMTNYKTLWSNNSYQITKVKMSPDGKRIIAAEDAPNNDNILVFDASDGSVIKVIPSGSYAVHNCAVSPDGRYFAFSTADYPTGTIQIFSLSTLTKIREISMTAYSVAFTHDSKYIVAANSKIRAYRMSDGTDMGDLAPSLQDGVPIVNLSFNRTDNMLVAGRSHNIPAIIKLSKKWRSR